MKTTVIHCVAPSYGPTFVECEYVTTPIHAINRYRILNAWFSSYGKRGESIDVEALINMNSLEELDTAIVESTQGHYRQYLEAQGEKPTPPKKMKIKIKREDEGQKRFELP